MATPVPVHVPLASVLIVGALVAWRLFRRVRRLVARQPFRAARVWLSLVLFPVLALTMLAGLYAHPPSVGIECIGLLIGAGLAVYGIRLTKFEITGQGLYYTPNAHIGIALSLLIAARVLYRFAQLAAAPSSMGGPSYTLVQSPLTVLLVGTLAGYYACYALGLILWAGKASKTASVALQDPGEVQ